MVHPNLKNYAIVLSHDARKSLNRVDKKFRSRILEKINLLCSNVESLDIKKLKATSIPLYRLRVGDFRVIYSINHGEIEIYVLSFDHRRDAYKNI